MAKWRSTTSSAKSAPAMGALKLADTAAATAQPKRSRPVMPSALINPLTQLEITAARWTTGPSRPDEPPVPSVIKDATAEASPARFSTRPLFIAAPSITSATERTRPSGVNTCKMTPVISPPVMGINTIQYHSRSVANSCNSRMSLAS